MKAHWLAHKHNLEEKKLHSENDFEQSGGHPHPEILGRAVLWLTMSRSGRRRRRRRPRRCTRPRARAARASPAASSRGKKRRVHGCCSLCSTINLPRQAVQEVRRYKKHQKKKKPKANRFLTKFKTGLDLRTDYVKMAPPMTTMTTMTMKTMTTVWMADRRGAGKHRGTRRRLPCQAAPAHRTARHQYPPSQYPLLTLVVLLLLLRLRRGL